MSRRSVIAAFACSAALPVAAPLLATVAKAQFAADDERFMRMAIEEARRPIFRSAP